MVLLHLLGEGDNVGIAALGNGLVCRGDIDLARGVGDVGDLRVGWTILRSR